MYMKEVTSDQRGYEGVKLKKLVSCIKANGVGSEWLQFVCLKSGWTWDALNGTCAGELLIVSIPFTWTLSCGLQDGYNYTEKGYIGKPWTNHRIMVLLITLINSSNMPWHRGATCIVCTDLSRKEFYFGMAGELRKMNNNIIWELITVALAFGVRFMKLQCNVMWGLRGIRYYNYTVIRSQVCQSRIDRGQSVLVPYMPFP